MHGLVLIRGPISLCADVNIAFSVIHTTEKELAVRDNIVTTIPIVVGVRGKRNKTVNVLFWLFVGDPLTRKQGIALQKKVKSSFQDTVLGGLSEHHEESKCLGVV